MTRFIADVMLGRLARLMRFHGYDVEYDRAARDSDLLRMAPRRMLLTKDRGLAASGKRRNVYLVQSIGGEKQLEEIRRKFPQSSNSTRCLICNHAIRKVRPDKIRHLVPPFVYEHHSQFYRCPKCHRIYWKGTHFRRMSQAVK
jgi:uncharacterized protein with PIN domain